MKKHVGKYLKLMVMYGSETWLLIKRNEEIFGSVKGNKCEGHGLMMRQ